MQYAIQAPTKLEIWTGNGDERIVPSAPEYVAAGWNTAEAPDKESPDPRATAEIEA